MGKRRISTTHHPTLYNGKLGQHSKRLDSMKNGFYHLMVFALLFAIPVLVVQQVGLGLLSWLASLIPVAYLLVILLRGK